MSVWCFCREERPCPQFSGGSGAQARAGWCARARMACGSLLPVRCWDRSVCYWAAGTMCREPDTTSAPVLWYRKAAEEFAEGILSLKGVFFLIESLSTFFWAGVQRVGFLQVCSRAFSSPR